MKLVSTGDFFGRLEDGVVTPMGRSIIDYLSGAAELTPPQRAPVPLAELKLGPAVPRPSKIIGVGPNYHDHAAEAAHAAPPELSALGWFCAFASSVVGPGDPIVIPAGVTAVDWEAELGVVIGKNVGVAEALEHVAGYVCVNDVSARELQRRNTLKGKAIDTFFPVGAGLVTADEFGDWRGRRVRSYLNGQLYQDASTDAMIYGVEELISSISALISLEPGDIIATGTPVGTGGYSDPQRYLQDGDVIRVEVEGLTGLANPVVQA